MFLLKIQNQYVVNIKEPNLHKLGSLISDYISQSKLV